MSQFPLTIAIVVFYDCPMLNIELLQKVKAAILAHPHDFDMDDWVQSVGCSNVREQGKSCGTTACIAGWAVSLDKKITIDLLVEDGEPIFSHACLALGINQTQAYKLFHFGGWPDRYCERYDNATTDQERAQAAADYIDYFIEKNKDNNTPAPPVQ